jgi:hypothetical protein
MMASSIAVTTMGSTDAVNGVACSVGPSNSKRASSVARFRRNVEVVRSFAEPRQSIRHGRDVGKDVDLDFDAFKPCGNMDATEFDFATDADFDSLVTESFECFEQTMHADDEVTKTITRQFNEPSAPSVPKTKATFVRSRYLKVPKN